MLCNRSQSTDDVSSKKKEYTIGLNEAQFGLVAPPFFADTLRNTIGTRQAERCLQLGLLVPPKEAHSIGLVDEILPLEGTSDSPASSALDARALEEIKVSVNSSYTSITCMPNTQPHATCTCNMHIHMHIHLHIHMHMHKHLQFQRFC